MKPKIYLPSSLVLNDNTLSVQFDINVEDLLNAAKAEPVKVKGRPRQLTSEQEKLLKALVESGVTNPEDICQAFGISLSSYFRYRDRLQVPKRQYIKATNA